MKEIYWDPRALKAAGEFPEEVDADLHEFLQRLQIGEHLTLPFSRSMNIVAPGVSELRLKDRDGIYRVFYYLKLENKIRVFHAFQKKTQKTPHEEIDTARTRLKRMLRRI